MTYKKSKFTKGDNIMKNENKFETDKIDLTSVQQQTLQKLLNIKEFLMSNLQAVNIQISQFVNYLKREYNVDDTWLISEDLKFLIKVKKSTQQKDKDKED